MSWATYRAGTLIEQGDDDTRAVYGPRPPKIGA